jgi:hypothetical protein
VERRAFVHVGEGSDAHVGGRLSNWLAARIDVSSPRGFALGTVWLCLLGAILLRIRPQPESASEMATGVHRSPA